MQTRTIGNLEILSYAQFEAHRGVSNIVTTRDGGRSQGGYRSLNLAFHVGDDPETVLENRRLLAQALAVAPESLTLAEQIHGSDVIEVGAPQVGRGAVARDDALTGADALVTDVPDVPLVVLVADCVAVSLFDPQRRVIGLAHAGWRGTVARIAERTAEAMKRNFGCDPKRMVAGLSPAIGRDHYEVGEEVVTAVRTGCGREQVSEFIQEDMDGTCYLDLWGLNVRQLVACGILPRNIDVSGLCTACHTERFFSHRHEGGKTGRFAALLMLHDLTTRQY